MTTILWFKRDLRVADHTALANAAAQGPVLPLYILEPGYWARPDTSGRQFDFLVESLRDLKTQLAGIGLTLCLRTGDAVPILAEMQMKTGAKVLVSHEETGNDWTYARDRAVAEWARGAGVIWQEFPQCAVVRRLATRDVWAQGRNRFVGAAQVPVPTMVSGITHPSDPVRRLTAPDPTRERQKGGRAEALRLLDSFLQYRGETYRRDMSSPLTGATSCSRLSPYLALGCVSVREVAQAASGAGKSTTWSKSLKSFQSRLAWRDHFIQKLEDEPALEWRCLHAAYEGLRVDDPVKRQAWEQGQTGLPFVDACMRSLAATGWLNFRMRSMVMAVASYHLWLDWRQTGLHLARQFTDYEPGIHWSQVQMQSGTTGMNTVRIYNPVKQGKDQDPDGVFTRRWVPELADVPLDTLQEPWLWPGSCSYPAPIVDVAKAARHAREVIYGVRGKAGFREEAQVVIQKHASRKDPQRHFVNDRARRGRKPGPDPRQTTFDFS